MSKTQPDLPPEIATALKAFGYSLEEEIANTTRNAVYKISRDNQTYICKISLSKESILMENEIWWCHTIRRMSDTRSPIAAPAIYEHGPNWFVQEYVDQRLLVSKDAPDPNEFTGSIDRMVAALTWLDNGMTPAHTRPLYDPTDSAPYHDLLKKVDGWMEKPLDMGLISQTQLTAAKKLVDNYKGSIVPRLQHGDFVPWHMFDMGDKVGLFDGEHASLSKPRYYDLAYLYTRICTRAQAPESARDILRRFMVAAKVEKGVFTRAFLPVMTLRALGMQTDAVNDLELIDYREQAQDILKRCLQDDLAALIKA